MPFAILKLPFTKTYWIRSKHSVLHFTPACFNFDKFRLWQVTARDLHERSSFQGKASRTGFNDYEAQKNLKVVIPEKFNFASDVIDIWAHKEKAGKRKNYPPAFWFVYEDGRQLTWNFQDLEQESKKTANILQNVCGIQRGENVMVILPKIPEFWLVNLAAIRIGAVLSTGSSQLTPKDIKYRLEAFRPVCVIATENVADSIDQVADFCPSLRTKLVVSHKNETRKQGWLHFDSMQEQSSSEHKCVESRHDESMMVFFTSGSTGFPKMVDHSHSSYGIGIGLAGRYWMDLTSSNVIWNYSDTGWAKTAYSNLFGPWTQGACVFVHQMARFSPTNFIKVLERFPIDTVCAHPTTYRMLLQSDLQQTKFLSLQHCLSAGELLNPEVIHQWRAATGLEIYQGYGQTETSILLGTYRCLKDKPGSIGKPFPGTDIAILNDEGEEVGPGTEGEIVINLKTKRPIGIFKGYKNDPERTAATLTKDYFHTGDRAYYDDEGYFWYMGRNDDIINSASYRIGPFEVESALIEHPAVVEAAAVSSPDPTRGEVVKAFVILHEDYLNHDKEQLIEELQQHAMKVTAPYKYPRKIEFVDELPKTVSGKIKRFELRNREWKRV